MLSKPAPGYFVKKGIWRTLASCLMALGAVTSGMPETIPSSILQQEIERRRTFAIISHPDAGKTTLTEKLLLYGGAIRLAGAVRKKSGQKHTSSDWMEIEKQRGISVTTSVLGFSWKNNQINLLDTPGHKDFSEDTYRTIVAADSAVMLLDAAKGVEPQTLKLFEVCRMRGLPIFTFINKLDHFGREPLNLLEDIEKILGIQTFPVTWPIGMGTLFRGVYDRTTKEVFLFDKSDQANSRKALAPITSTGIDDPNLKKLVDPDIYDQFRLELDLLDSAGDAFDLKAVLKGDLTPVFFGSAMNNFGVEHFLNKFVTIAPSPTPRVSQRGPIEPASPDFSAFVFKIQANMDPQHRDRVAFIRICSGKFVRGLEVTHARLQEKVKLARPIQFFGQDREVVEEAWPGDVIGILDTTGELRIGDTLFCGEQTEYQGVPRFPPEFFANAVSMDPLKRKQFQKGLKQLSEEGVIQVFSQPSRGDQDPILGAVGLLQFEVFQHRINHEYGATIRIDKLAFKHACWISGTGFNLDDFNSGSDTRYVVDRDGKPVILFATDWSLNWNRERLKDAVFSKNPT